MSDQVNWQARKEGQRYAKSRLAQDIPIEIRGHWSNGFKLGIFDVVTKFSTEDVVDVLEPFWVVWNPLGGSPTIRHPSCAQANEEASRLAKENPGHDFFVLGATDRHRAVNSPVVHVRVKRHGWGNDVPTDQ